MKLVTVVSDSHRRLWKRLSESCIQEYSLRTIEIPQYGRGLYHKTGFRRSMLAKVVGIRAELTEPLVYSDADVVFLQPSVVQLLEELGDRDCAFQNDNGECCAGFFVMHNTKESLTLLDNVISDLRTNINDDQFGDQKFLNERLKSSSVKYRLLSARFANPHTISGSHWTGRDLGIPRDTLMFHANWTEGILNKELLLDMVIRNARRTIQ